MKNKRFLIIYGIIILIALIVIIFVLPDKLFKKEPTKIEIVDDSVALKDQINALNNNHYEYKYLIQYSVEKDENIYKCSGKKDGDTETGSCTSPSNFEYTNTTKKEVFKTINTDCLELQYIFDLIKDIEPRENNLGNTIIYIYKTKIDNVDTEISLYSDYKELIQIEINNIYGTYVITLSNIS